MGGIIYFNGLTYKDVKVIDNKITFDGKKKEEKEKIVISLSTSESKVYEVENLKLYLNGKEIKLENRILEKNQRFYIDLEEFLRKGKLKIMKRKIKFIK